MNSDKGLFFLTLSLICIWLVIDNFVGNKNINKFITNMFGLKGLDTGETKQSEEDIKVEKVIPWQEVPQYGAGLEQHLA